MYISSLHQVVYMKSVKEWEEINYTSLQSSRSLFRKIQIFKFAYSALLLFYSLFRLSHRGVRLLWHWICLFQYMIIHFVSFRFAKYSKPWRDTHELKKKLEGREGGIYLYMAWPEPELFHLSRLISVMLLRPVHVWMAFNNINNQYQ